MHSFIQSRASVASRARARSQSIIPPCVCCLSAFIYIYIIAEPNEQVVFWRTPEDVCCAPFVCKIAAICALCTEIAQNICIYIVYLWVVCAPPAGRQYNAPSSPPWTKPRHETHGYYYHSIHNESTRERSEYISHMVIIIASRSFATFSRPGMGDAVAAVPAVVQSRRTHAHTHSCSYSPAK